MNRNDLDILYNKRLEDGFGAIEFRKGDEVICIYAGGCKNLSTGCKYTVGEYEVIKDQEGLSDSESVYVIVGTGNGYRSKYTARRFTLSEEQLKIRERETKIDSIVR